MKRKIINIDKNLCNGCGLCVSACHEGAIGLDKEGKAYLLREDYCDGLGDCLPVCPTNAITFIEKEALAYNEDEVKKNIANKKLDNNFIENTENKINNFTCQGMAIKSFSKTNIEENIKTPIVGGCPGKAMRSLNKTTVNKSLDQVSAPAYQGSMLNQWPVQIKLVPVNAPYFNGAKLLIAADCSAFACGDFHNRFMKDKITIIGCPKLDDGDYSEKLTAILNNNDIKSVTVVKMEVPCCTGLLNAAVKALKNSDKMIPWSVVTLSLEGEVIE